MYSTRIKIFFAIGWIKATNMNNKQAQELHKIQFINVVPKNMLSCVGSHIVNVSSMDTGH